MKYNKEILNRFTNEKVAIQVETQQEWIDFMKLLESETECKWSNRYLPTQRNYWSDYEEYNSVTFNFDGRGGLGFGTSYFYQSEGWVVIKYIDLIKGEETMINIEEVNKALKNADEDKIKEVLKLLGIKDYGKFIPKHREKYYYIDDLGNATETFHDNQTSDFYRLLMGNVHRTEEEAEQALDFQTRKAKLIREIEDSSDVIDWSDREQVKYSIYFVHVRNLVCIQERARTQNQESTYTTNLQYLEELIITRADEVKELLFGLKENK